MIIHPTPLEGLLIIESERLEDDRGFFARTYDVDELGPVVQMSISFNPRAGTLRGLHFQQEPHAETKLVRCTRGAAFDVAVDLRPGSPTLHRWHAVDLSDENGLAMLIPPGMAHGFQTLRDDTELLYAMSTPHVPEAARSIRWSDPLIGIEWPEPPSGERVISEADEQAPLIATG